MRILVTGGAGYIGSHMVRLLLDEGHVPIVFDDMSNGYDVLLPEDVVTVRGDILDKNAVNHVFDTHSFDAVMHFAGKIVVPESVEYPERYYENNVMGSLNLMNACIKHKVDRFIFSSTAAVYSSDNTMPVTEDAVLAPENPYGHSKLMVERILQDMCRAHDMKSVIFRYFNVAGAHHSGDIGLIHPAPTHLLPSIIKALSGQRTEFCIYGTDYETKDGTCVRDFIHVEDLCRAHLLGLQHFEDLQGYDVFNLGSGSGYSVQEVLSAAQRLVPKIFSIKQHPRRAGDAAMIIASNEKAKKVLGWAPEKTLDDMILSAWAWEEKSRG